MSEAAPKTMAGDESRSEQKGFFLHLLRTEVSAEAISWHRFFGALALVLLALLFLSGTVMMLAYTPFPGTAYDSVDYFQFTLPWGIVVRGVHHYAWNLLLMIMGIHLFRALVMGAYKAPRQSVWISGLMFFLIMPLFIITGDLLPWDQKGYWSTQVRFSIIGTMPLIGEFIGQMLRGGPLTGIVALTRMYALHVVVLPAALVALLGVHLYLVGTRGLSGPLNAGPNAPKVPFFPHMVNRWLVLFMLTTIVLGLVSWQWPADLGDPADPTDSAYIPRPEWWVLFLNQLVSIFRGPFTVLGSAVIPGGILVLLGALPFLDKSVERHPAKRKWVMISAAILVVAVVALSVMGYVEHFVLSAHE